MKKPLLSVSPIFMLMAVHAMAAPRSYTGTAITENFDGLGTTGTSITLLTGWDAGYFNPAIQQGTTGGNGATTVTAPSLLVDNGGAGVTNPVLVNIGTTGSSDRALGSFARTTGNGDQFFQLAIKNDSGSPISSFVLSYTGEEWRSSATPVQQLTTWYSNTSATSGFVSMGSTFTFNTPNNSGSGQIDGNASGNFTAISGTYTPASPIPAGSTFYIRWYDINDNGISDDYLAIDDLTVTPALQISTVSANNGDWHATATWSPAIVPTPTSPVTVNGNAVTITSAAANCNTLTLAGGGSVAATGQVLTVADGTLGALNTTSGTLTLDGTSTLNLAKANTSASFAGLTVATGTILNVTGELIVDTSKDLSGATINTPKLTLAGGLLTDNAGVSIGSGQLISGSGTVIGRVSVGGGGKASPGTDTAIGTITTTGLTLDGGSLLTFNAASTVSRDQIAVGYSDGLTINGGAITFLNGTGSGPASGIGTYNLISYSGVIGGAGVSALSVANPVPGTRYSFGASGSFVTLDLIQGPLWSGSSGGPWSVAANWSGAAPGASDTLVYAAGGTSGSSVNDLTGAAFPSIQFESGVNAFTLSGNKVVLTGDLNGAFIVNNSANLQTLGLPIGINSALAVNTASGAVTLGGEVSGTGTLVKSGTGTLTLGGSNIHTGGTNLGAGKLVLGSTSALGATAGAFTIAGGTTLDSSVANLVIANNNPQVWNGNFTFTGSQNLNLGSGAVTVGANCEVTVSANTLTVGGAITGSGKTLTKRGAGTLVLNGAGSAVTKVQIYGGGTLQVGSGAGLTSTSSLDITEVSTLLVSSGAFTAAGADEGHDGQRASVIVEGTGTITSNGEWLMGRNMGSTSLIVKDSGIINGGANPLRIGRDNIRDNYVALRNNAQATFGAVVVFDTSGYAEGGAGSGSVLEVNDSASLTASSMTIANNLPTNNATHPKYGIGQVYQSGGTVTVNGNIGMALTTTDASDVLTATYNLGNGMLKCRQINNGANTLRGTANVNFHGGTLTYNDTVAQTDFINLGAAGKLYLYEGVTVDDNGQAVTINQPLLTPNSGQGLASITLATPIGAVNAYAVTPEVLVTGGGGSGATAIAVLNGSGQVSAIKVTNPGLGYTSTPSVQLFFQGGATAVPGTGINLTANAFTGGLTKKGAGTLTLAGANTYTGATIVAAGILAVNGTAIPDAGKLVINTGGKVQPAGTETVDTLYFGGTPKAVGTWGATGSGAANIDDNHFTGTAGVVNVLHLGIGSDYDTWAGLYPAADLTNPDADFDHDGRSNREEYAFGLDPTKGSSVNPISVPPNKTTGVFKYTRRATPATTGLTYTVWTSTNLATWTKDDGATTGQTVESTSNGVETVAVTLTGAPLTEAKLFMRVTAE